MRRTSSLLAAVAVAALALTPAVADARAGGGSSAGSRGSRTYSAPPSTNTAPGTAAPMERSAAQRPVGGPVGAPQQGGSRFGGFGAGLMGGLLGVGLGGLLFGSGLFGGMSGIVGLLGFALQLALAFFVIRWLVRRFMGNRQPAMAGGAPNMFARNAQPQPDARVMGGGVARPVAAPAEIVQADYQSFDRLLNQVQAAWTARNLPALRAMATPEMAGYFEEQLAAQNARGVRNEVTNVKLEQGDLSEAWREGSMEYATVAMRFSMIDVTHDASGRVVEGNAEQRTMATELWTFVRTAGHPWAVSAIQQAR